VGDTAITAPLITEPGGTPMTDAMPSSIIATTEDRLAALGHQYGDLESWPAATSFPMLDETSPLSKAPDWGALAEFMGGGEGWPSGTSFPELD
jgi:hypothetical protein